MKGNQYILSSIIISFCAAALSLQVSLFLKFSVRTNLLIFVFFATLFSYNYYWFFTNISIAVIKRSLLVFLSKRKLPFLLICIAGLYMLYFIYENRDLFPAILVTMLLNGLYMMPVFFRRKASRLHSFGFLKTTLLAFTWALFTVWLPAGGGYMGAQAWLLILHYFFLLFILNIIFDIRDIKIDRIKKLYSIATDISKPKLTLIFLLFTSAFTFLSFFLHLDAFNMKAAFVSVFMPILLSLLFFASVRKKQGAFFYYLIVDGCLILYPLLTYIATL